jgi:DNA-binding MarR family transcriptional regulator
MENPLTLPLFAEQIQQKIYELVRYYAICDRVCTQELSVTATQGYILLALPDDASITMNDLSVAMRLANSTMTRMVDQLIQKGLVVRESDPQDRRVVRVRINAHGSDIKARFKQAQQELFAQVLKDIPASEWQNVISGLENLNQSCLTALKSCCGEEVGE